MRNQDENSYSGKRVYVGSSPALSFNPIGKYINPAVYTAYNLSENLTSNLNPNL